LCRFFRLTHRFFRAALKRTLIWCLLGFVLLVSAAWSQAQKSGGTEQAVAALEQQWLQSQKTNSPDVLAPLLADKLVSTNSDGQVAGKAETLARAKSIKYDSAENNDLKPSLFGRRYKDKPALHFHVMWPTCRSVGNPTVSPR